MAQAWNWYEPGIKKDFEEMEHEFAFGIFLPSSRNFFLLERPKKSCSIHFPTAGFPETLCE